MSAALKKLNQQTSKNSHNATSLLALVDGPTHSGLQASATMSLFGPEAVPVRHSRVQENRKPAHNAVARTLCRTLDELATSYAAYAATNGLPMPATYTRNCGELIRDGRPVKFFGEQVASDDGRTWLASVRASLEILGYEVGAADICSAGVGSADIRQRLYFVADTASARQTRRQDGRTDRVDAGAGLRGVEFERSSTVGELGQPNRTGSQSRGEGSTTVGYGSSAITTSGLGKLGITTKGRRGSRRTSEEIHGQEPCGETERSSNAGELGNASSKGQQGRELGTSCHGDRNRQEAHGSISESSEALGAVAYTNSIESSNGELQRGRRLLQPTENPLTGFWSNAEWIFCRDEKWRPVEPGTFPLASGIPARVGRLRAYGNAINAEVAKAFIEAYMSI